MKEVCWKLKDLTEGPLSAVFRPLYKYDIGTTSASTTYMMQMYSSKIRIKSDKSTPDICHFFYTGKIFGE